MESDPQNAERIAATTLVASEDYLRSVRNDAALGRAYWILVRLMAAARGRALDLPGLGPAVDLSETARERFFGEDISERTRAEEPPQKEDGIVTKTSEFDARAVGREFLVALRNRDFGALEYGWTA